MATPKTVLLLDFEAIVRLEEKGISILDGGLKEADMKKTSTYLLLVWAGLLHANPEATDADARAWAKGMSPKQLIGAVTNALQEAVGSDEEKPADTSSASS